MVLIPRVRTTGARVVRASSVADGRRMLMVAREQKKTFARNDGGDDASTCPRNETIHTWWCGKMTNDQRQTGRSSSSPWRAAADRAATAAAAASASAPALSPAGAAETS